MRTFKLFASLVVLAACGNDGVEPTLIPGGGVRDPGVSGTMYVHVIDEDDDSAIGGADVYIDDLAGVTDGEGLFEATEVDGPQTITVVASGYTPTTWIGVDGANVTIPLGRPAAPTTYDSGTATGTIEGWQDYDPAAQRVSIALVGYSLSNDDDDPANSIEQPDGDPAPNTCVNAGGPSPTCDWTLETRTGTQMIYALLGSIGTAEDIELPDFAYARGVEVADGETVSDVTLTMADQGDLIVPDVSLPSAPDRTDQVAALIEIELGDEGRLVLPLSGDITVPVPSDAIVSGARYHLLGIASAADGSAQSVRIDRDVDPADASVGLLLPVPSGVATDGDTFQFQAAADTQVSLHSIVDASGDTLWGVAVFDGTGEFSRPAEIDFPSGTLHYGVQNVELTDFDPNDFAIDDIDELVTRASSYRVQFTQ